MKPIVIFILISLVLFAQSLRLSAIDGGSQNVSKFVSDLVRDAVASENSNFFDVLLLQIENKAETDIYGKITSKISPAAMLTVDCFFPREFQILQRFSMIIVVTDDNNGVIKKSKK